MRKTLTVLVTVLLCSVTVHAQKLVTNKKDRFTQAYTKVTSKEKIWRNTVLGGLIDVYAKSADGYMSLWLVMHERSIFSMSEGDALYIALEDGNSVRLECVSGTIARHGENLWHGTVGYRVTEEDYKALISSPATAIRIDETRGYVEKEIREKHRTAIGDCLKLVR